MDGFGSDIRINKNYGQPLFDNGTLFFDENAAIAEMKKQYMAKQREMRVREALFPYIHKDSKVTYYDAKRDLYRMRIPIALRKKNTYGYLTARTKQPQGSSW